MAMYTEMSSQHLGHVISELTRHWEKRRRHDASEPNPEFAQLLSIALEREAGAQGTSVGEALGKRLGWTVYDHQLLERIAEDMGVRTSLLKSVDARRKSWLEETVETFMDVPEVSESAYVRRLIETVLALGVHGECVIVGRGAAFILPAHSTLRVRLIAAPADRIKVLRNRFNMSERDAEREATKIDRERADFVREHFLKDPTDPQNYDLIMNVSRFTAAAAADVIIDALQRLQTSVAGGHFAPVHAAPV
jgi:cytidylate kinase